MSMWSTSFVDFCLQIFLMLWIGCPNSFFFLLHRYGCRYCCQDISGMCTYCLSNCSEDNPFVYFILLAWRWPSGSKHVADVSLFSSLLWWNIASLVSVFFVGPTWTVLYWWIVVLLLCAFFILVHASCVGYAKFATCNVITLSIFFLT